MSGGGSRRSRGRAPPCGREGGSGRILHRRERVQPALPDLSEMAPKARRAR